MSPPRLLRASDALFLDLDGTLAPIEASPDLVRPVERRSRLLLRLTKYLDGALAILSGRTVEDIDRIVAEGCIAVAGVHGLVRRTSAGHRIDVRPSDRMQDARQRLAHFLSGRPGLFLEDKRHALAVHFREDPSAEDAVLDVCERLAADYGLSVQMGHKVCELRTPGPTKGDALLAFLGEEPFRGRTPVMAGDDLTDEFAFQQAARSGGFGVLVGPARETAAGSRLQNVDQVFGWLEASLEGAPT